MTTTKKIFAALAFAGAALLGPSAGANEPMPEPMPEPTPTAPEGGFLAFEIVAQDPMSTVLLADVAPWYEGRHLIIQFGPEAGTGDFIAATPLHAGQNTIVVPSFPHAGWYTGTVEATARTVKNSEDWGLE